MSRRRYDKKILLPEGTKPSGMYVFGGYLFISDLTTKKLLAWKINDAPRTTTPVMRESEKDIDVLDAAGNDVPVIALAKGYTLYVYDRQDEKLYNYTVSFDAKGLFSSARRGPTSKDVSKAKFHSGGHSPRYPSGFAEVPPLNSIYVCDPYEDTLFAYDPNTWARKSENDWRGMDMFTHDSRYPLIPGGMFYQERPTWDYPKRIYINDLNGNPRSATFSFDVMEKNDGPRELFGFYNFEEYPNITRDNLLCGPIAAVNYFYFLMRPTHFWVISIFHS